MSKKTTMISGAQLAYSGSHPVEILPTPPEGTYYFPRHMLLRHIPGETPLADGGELKMRFGDTDAKYTGIGHSFYANALPLIIFTDVHAIMNGQIFVTSSYCNGPYTIGLSAGDVPAADSSLEVTVYYSTMPLSGE